MTAWARDVRGTKHKQSNHSFLNMLLTDFTTTNLYPVIQSEIVDGQQALALACTLTASTFLGLILSHQSFNSRCGGPTAQSGKPLADLAETLLSSGYA